jgi:hypothetical protein
MKPKTIAIITTVVVVVIVAILCIGGGISISNEEVDLRNTYNAELDHNKMVKNKTFEVVHQIANVASQYADDFIKVWATASGSRYANDKNVVFKWIKEQNPNFTPEMYSKLDNAIEANKTEFLLSQTKLRDIKKEHDNLRTKFPSSMIVGSRKELEAYVIVSGRTTHDFQTKIDSDTENVFGKK